MLEKITSTAKDLSATCTVVMRTNGIMESGVMQTSSPVLMPRNIHLILFPDMELAKLLVVAKLYVRNIYQGRKRWYVNLTLGHVKCDSIFRYSQHKGLYR